MDRGLTILTLDAGGTNFVFSAVRNNEEIVAPVTLPAHADSLDRCIDSLITGFRQVMTQADSPDAISFAFPGPADYAQGIIGDLPNFPAFNAPVPLKDILEEAFDIPVFINNDADLFAAGEALAGFLPSLNNRLKESGSSRRFSNLIGITLGTGFGCGIVIDGKMLVGDNSSAAEIHNSLNPFNPAWNAEEDVSTRAILRNYFRAARIPGDPSLMPRDIHQIAMGTAPGDAQSAMLAFKQFGRSLGASIANVLTLIDGVVVIGGGLTGAWEVFAPSMFAEITKPYSNAKGESFRRLSTRVFNLENTREFRDFVKGNPVEVASGKKTRSYDAMPRTGIGKSALGVSRATALGAYAFAINRLTR